MGSSAIFLNHDVGEKTWHEKSIEYPPVLYKVGPYDRYKWGEMGPLINGLIKDGFHWGYFTRVL